MASALACARAHAEDVLIVTAGGVKTGTLEGCSGGVCTLDGAAIPRASIYYIGLDAELPPPAPQDGTRDEVHLRDGSVQPGPLISIDASNVVTAGAIHPRKLVAWIWLTPLTPGRGQGQAAPSTTTADGEADEKKDRPTYEWEGTIRVENRYNDTKYGRHRWQAEYRVKFLEVNPEGPYPSPDSGRLISNNRLEPLELGYEYHADQAWQVWLNDDLMKTISMHGQASGHSQGGSPDNGIVISGTIWGLYEPWAEPHRAPSSFASLADAGSYASDHWAAAPEPGWYHFDVEIWGTETERRALYDGIERGGTYWADHLDANRNFLDNIPVCMPTPTWITGRLDRPDQSEVHGGFTYPYRSGDDTAETPNEITVEWSFMRTRL
jgi:hypothetical protein